MLLAMNLKKTWRSAVSSESSYCQFISNCPFASSWSLWYGCQPSASIASLISAITS